MYRQFFLGICLLVFSPHLVQAQTPFAQVNQLPLHLNPSMAGSKEKQRVSFGMNALNQNQSKYSNLAIGYDQFSRKIGSGIGAYFLYRNLQEGLMPSAEQLYMPDHLSQQEFFNKQKQYLAGICIAPKYNIKSATSRYKAKYTFSPSLFFEAGKITNSSCQNFDTTNMRQIIYSTDHPDGIYSPDSLVANYSLYNFTDRIIRSGIGFQLNSERMLVSSRISFERSAYNETTTVVSYSYNTKTEEQSQAISSDAVLYAFESTINFGYSFSRRDNALFVFTPIVGIGMKHYLNLEHSNTADGISSNACRFLLNNASITQLTYLHISANARYQKFLFGFAYTEYFNCTFEGLSLGFQNDWLKIMSTMGLAITGKDRNYKLFELTTDILIR